MAFVIFFGVSQINKNDQKVSSYLKHKIINSKVSNHNGIKNIKVILI